jgi:hypothetical protein
MITAAMERDQVRAIRGATDAVYLDSRSHLLGQQIADLKRRSVERALGMAPAFTPERHLEETRQVNRLARVLYACTSRALELSTSRALELTKKGGRSRG